VAAGLLDQDAGESEPGVSDPGLEEAGSVACSLVATSLNGGEAPVLPQDALEAAPPAVIRERMHEQRTTQRAALGVCAREHNGYRMRRSVLCECLIQVSDDFVSVFQPD